MPVEELAPIVTVKTAQGKGQPRPFLLPLRISGNNVDVTWTTVSNGIYRLEYNSVPGPSNWLPLTGDLTALSNTLSTTDALTQSNRLYRVRARR